MVILFVVVPRFSHSTCFSLLRIWIDLNLDIVYRITYNHSYVLFCYSLVLFQIPDFAVRAEKTRSLTNALYLNIYANVESHQRQEWQDYCAQHGRHWVDETIRVQQLEGIFTDAVNVPTWNVIWDYRYVRSSVTWVCVCV